MVLKEKENMQTLKKQLQTITKQSTKSIYGKDPTNYEDFVSFAVNFLKSMAYQGYQAIKVEEGSDFIALYNTTYKETITPDKLVSFFKKFAKENGFNLYIDDQVIKPEYTEIFLSWFNLDKIKDNPYDD